MEELAGQKAIRLERLVKKRKLPWRGEGFLKEFGVA